MTLLAYPLPLFLGMICLALWSHFSKVSLLASIFRNVLYIAMAVYGVEIIFAEVSWSVKLGNLFRDFMLLAGVGMAFQWWLKQQTAFWIGFLLLLGAIGWSMDSGWLDFPSHHQSTEMTVPLDPNGELLVALRAGNSITDLEAQLTMPVVIERAFYPANPEQTTLDDYVVVDTEPGDLAQAYQEISNLPFVDWVEGNEVITLDPLAETEKWEVENNYFNDPLVDEQWGLLKLEAAALHQWLKTSGYKPKKHAIIAILDTGIDSQHEDLKGHYHSINKNFDYDRQRHGTHCAGIAAAVSNNGKGIASLIPNPGYVKVTSVSVMNSLGIGTQKSIMEGIIKAADHGVDVISLSLGGKPTKSKQIAYRNAVQYANGAGAIVVAAAGNSKIDAQDYAPVNTPGVIGVAAVDSDLNRAFFSNYVNHIEMAVSAPGLNVMSTIPNNEYAAHNGTSMAAPHVSGLIGLMRSFDPNISTREAFNIIHETGKPTNDLLETGYFIQPFAAVKAVIERTVPVEMD